MAKEIKKTPATKTAKKAISILPKLKEAVLGDVPKVGMAKPDIPTPCMPESTSIFSYRSFGASAEGSPEVQDTEINLQMKNLEAAYFSLKTNLDSLEYALYQVLPVGYSSAQCACPSEPILKCPASPLAIDLQSLRVALDSITVQVKSIKGELKL